MKNNKKNLEENILVYFVLILTGLIFLKIIIGMFNKELSSDFEKFITYLIGCSVFISIPYCIKGGYLLSIDFITSKYPKKIRWVLERIIGFITFIIMIILSIGSILAFKNLGTLSNNMLNLMNKVLYIIPIVCFILSTYRAFQNLKIKRRD